MRVRAGSALTVAALAAPLGVLAPAAPAAAVGVPPNPARWTDRQLRSS